MTFLAPNAWFLLLLLCLPLIIWRWKNASGTTALSFSSTATAAKAPRTMVVRTRWIVLLLRTVAITMLIVCVARPLKGNQMTRTLSDGIAIEMVVDRSGSMRAMDFTAHGRRVDRLEAVKTVVTDFVLGAQGMPGRDNDLIGLISFARFADVNAPMTFDHNYLIDALDEVVTVPERLAQLEDGTAIGDATALAVERLTSLQDRLDLHANETIQSKIIILLTDGENNQGALEPIQAAEIAAALGIKIYTIGAGTDGVAPIPVTNLRGQTTIRHVPVKIDEETLQAIAAETGGRYFRATDSTSLAEIYAQIADMEKTEITQRQFMQYVDMAVTPVSLGRLSLPPLLVIAFLAVALEIALTTTRYRTTP